MEQTKELYLDLIKKALTFTLWDEPPIPIDMLASNSSSAVRRYCALLVSRILKRRNFQLVKVVGHSTDQKEQGQIWPRYAILQLV